MPRASFFLVRTIAATGALVALHCAVAGDRNGDRRLSNSFALVTATATPAQSPPPAPKSVGVAPAKPVVSNPYQVPLLQNAGTLRGAR